MKNQLDSPQRLEALRSTNLLDAPPEETFERLVDLATKLIGVPRACVNLIEPHRYFILTGCGLGDLWAERRTGPLSYSFCQYVVRDDQELIVEDARVHPVVRGNPAIEQDHVIAYAGVPLRMSSGEVLGSFCAFDSHPHQWTEAEIDALRTLADATMAEVELRIATRALREREKRFRGALEQVRAFAVTLDASARVTFVNDYFVEITGWSRDEAVGQDWFAFARGDEAERAAFRTAIAAGELPAANDGVLVTRSGEQRTVAWDNIPLFDDDGRAVGVAGIGHDVTVQRQAERLKGELIGIVSHEIRGPLTAIRASLKLFDTQAAALDERSRRMVDIAARNSDRLIDLVNDLLDLDRIESGALPMTRDLVAVCRVVDEACDATLPIAEDAGVTIERSCAGDTRVDVDLERTTQALCNLIRNAISFTPRGGNVVVAAEQRDGRVMFEVRDHGRGIPRDQLSAIFERFKQVSVSDSRERVGSGLGLAISRALVEQQGGEITVDSEVGKGSTFRVTFAAAG